MSAAASNDPQVDIFLSSARLAELQIADGMICDFRSEDPLARSLQGRVVRIYPTCETYVESVKEGGRIRSIEKSLFRVIGLQPLVVGQSSRLNQISLDHHRIRPPISEHPCYKDLLFEVKAIAPEVYQVTPVRKEDISLEMLGLRINVTGLLPRHRLDLLFLQLPPLQIDETGSRLPQFAHLKFRFHPTHDNNYSVTPFLPTGSP